MNKIYLSYLLLFTNLLFSQNTWKSKYLFQDNFSNNDLVFVTTEKGFVSGFGNDGKASIYYTSDGGVNWSEIFKTNNVSFQLSGLYFIDENIGWAVQGQKIYKTINNGSSWSNISLNNSQNGTLRKIFFKDQNNGILTTTLGILTTNDGGNNWTLNQMFDINNNILILSDFSIDKSTGNGFAIVNDKYIYETTNYGVNWIQKFTMQPTNSSQTHKLNRIDYRGLAVGEYYYGSLGYDGTSFLKTNNVWTKLTNNFIRFATASSFSDNLFFGYSENKIYDVVTKNISYNLPNNDYISKFFFINNMGYAIGNKSLYKYDSSVLSNNSFNYDKDINAINIENKSILFKTSILDPISYSVYDISGKLILKEENIILENKILIFKNTGIYIVKIFHNREIITKKLLIN
ncbi:T9SS type A sorting domain-containing protein [Flavobacterium psychrophilum]|uniref:T9SS type A sorting domain-containing protein n=1 Tax=Flavobacterium psychrophilum TaxID=96345 RepID=A0A7U2NH27_FLAPS|nr:YCF48-related protein [Flavobacterium psychrophilum]ELY2018598.1 T9SS type A sorting domain-containing protein [Flavobacterium psychrophilum]QRE04903.1 T9SS type A sorting domain-containing protein [Flavobacterium psychrophilum]